MDPSARPSGSRHPTNRDPTPYPQRGAPGARMRTRMVGAMSMDGELRRERLEWDGLRRGRGGCPDGIAALEGARGPRRGRRDRQPAPGGPAVAGTSGGVSCDGIGFGRRRAGARRRPAGRLAGRGGRPDPPDRADALAADRPAVPHARRSGPTARSRACGPSTRRPSTRPPSWGMPGSSAPRWARASCRSRRRSTSRAT